MGDCAHCSGCGSSDEPKVRDTAVDGAKTDEEVTEPEEDAKDEPKTE